MLTINSPPMDGGKTNAVVSKKRPAPKARSSKKWGWASHRYRVGKVGHKSQCSLNYNHPTDARGHLRIAQ